LLVNCYGKKSKLRSAEPCQQENTAFNQITVFL